MFLTFASWLHKTPISVALQHQVAWLWPMCETMHFAGLALLLSTLGLYGVLSFSALRRLREIGIRLAVGAQRSDIRALILGQGVRLLGIGLTIGFTGARLVG